MTDTEFCEHVLLRGPATTNDILRESFEMRGCGLTVHSRVADLRKLGYEVDCRCLGKNRGRNVFEYTLREAA